MKIIYCLFLIFLIPRVSAQNFYPLRTGDQFQEELHRVSHNNFGNWWQEYSYPKILISDALVINNITYYKHNDKYYGYDSLKRQLLIYLIGSSYIAVDFNQPVNKTKKLYFSGFPMEWYSRGISFNNILGENRLVYEMVADTAYEMGPAKYIESWLVQFAAGMGLYYTQYSKTQLSYPIAYYNISEHKLISVKIGNAEFNSVNNSISLADSVRDRRINDLPYALEVNIETPLPALISELYAEYNLYRNDNLVFSRNFDIDKSNFSAFINIQPEELEAGDIIKFRCVLRDSSIFNNFRTTPDSGYFSFKVLPDISSIEESYEIVDDHKLFQNYPNPFNSSTKINYTISEACFVTLKVFDLLGNEISTLINEEKQTGNYTVEFNAHNLTSALYFYRLQAENFIDTKKLVLIK